MVESDHPHVILHNLLPFHLRKEFISFANMSLVENNDPDSSEIQPNKRRRKKSVVWEHFTVETVSAECSRACCKQCKQTFAYSTGSKLAGTSHLKRHIALGTCLVNRRKERNQLAGFTPQNYKNGGNGNATVPSKTRHRGSSLSVKLPFDQDLCRLYIAKMIIMHEYALDMVEHPAFISFVQSLQPQFDVVSLDTVKGDIMDIYLGEKQELVKFLGGVAGRVCLSVDLWTSSKTLGYAFLTAHFMNSGWNLQRRVLNVVVLPSFQSKEAIYHAVGICIQEWDLENKLFSIAYDKDLLNDDAGDLKGYLCVKNPFMLNGQLLVEHCYTHVLSSIAQDALGRMWETINKVRESIKYITMSQTHEKDFLEIKQKLQIANTKHVSLDDHTQWNTTYLMLADAIELEEVFYCLEAADPDYKLALSIEEWTQVETLCTYLKLLYDAANVSSGTVQPTTNVYFHEALKIHLELVEGVMSHNPLICGFTRPLKEKFDLYWKNCSLILAIAVVMDPRFKLKLVELSFSKIYGEDAMTYVNIVDEGIHQLFSEYTVQLLPPAPTYMHQVSTSNVKTEDVLEVLSDRISLPEYDPSDFGICFSDVSCSQQTMLELDMYLQGSLVPDTQEFDLLDWWKLNNHKYPTLAKMAYDILCIPMSTVAAESVFDTGSSQLDSFRSSLQPEMLQALVCAKDWLQYGSTEAKNAIVKMEIAIL